MRRFNLRTFLPQPPKPSKTEAIAFESIGTSETASLPPMEVGADLAAWIDRLERAGIAADRPTSPDLLGQLRQAKGADTILCNLMEGDPVFGLNSAVAARETDAMLAGVELLDSLIWPKRSWILADEAGVPAWTARVRDAAKRSRRRFVTLRNDYPETDPSLLLYTLVKRRLAPGRLPTEQRVVVLDGVTAVLIGRLVLSQTAHRVTPIALHQPGWPAARLADVPVGSSLGTILSAIGVGGEELVVRTGDLLRDQKASSERVIGTGELTFHLMGRDGPVNPDPCIRCGWCYEGCPTRVHPAALLEAAQKQDLRLGRRFGLDSCIECGICTYVCPSRLPLLQSIRTLKSLDRSLKADGVPVGSAE